MEDEKAEGQAAGVRSRKASLNARGLGQQGELQAWAKEL